MSLTFIDFFAGIGGMRLGLEQAGHECIGFCEFDKFAVASYRAMHNTEGEWYSNDVRDIRANDIPKSDLWTAGFPCQDISIAGKQLGFDGKRSSLFFAVTRLIRDLEEEDRPSTLLFENVKNLLSVNGGVDFLKLQIELDEIGYDAEWQVLNSKDFGVPQNRERVFIVGHLRGRCGREIFPLRECNAMSIKQIGNIVNTGNWDNPQRGRIYSSEGICPALNTCGGGGLEPKVVVPAQKNIMVIGNVGVTGHHGEDVYDAEGISPSLKARDYKGPVKIAIPVLTPDRAEKRQNGRRFKEDGEPMFTLTAQDRHGVTIREATKQGYAIAEVGDSINLEQPNSKTRRGRVGKGVAQTLTTSCNQATLDGYRIRKLTPRECWRLQGFPGDYFEKAAAVNSDSQLYKQAGNAVTVSVVRAIGQTLAEVADD